MAWLISAPTRIFNIKLEKFSDSETVEHRLDFGDLFSLLTRSYVLTLRLCQPMSLQGDSDEVLFHIYAS